MAFHSSVLHAHRDSSLTMLEGCFPLQRALETHRLIAYAESHFWSLHGQVSNLIICPTFLERMMCPVCFVLALSLTVLLGCVEK
jgi:hypothetical protein